jgi:hypothetical protein
MLSSAVHAGSGADFWSEMTFARYLTTRRPDRHANRGSLIKFAGRRGVPQQADESGVCAGRALFFFGRGRRRSLDACERSSYLNSMKIPITSR